MRTTRTVGIVVAAGAAVALLVLVVVEAAMASASGRAATLYSVFAGATLAAGAVGWWLTRVHRRLSSLRWTIVMVPLAAVVVTTVAVAASTGAMFLAAAELRVVLAALLLGTGLGVVVAVSVTGPLTADLRRLAAAAREVADGDLGVRSEIERADEVGELARSLDRMVAQLAQARDQRERGEAARRRLVTSIGHDLRTPLASLQAAVEALEDGVAPDPERYLRSMGNDIDLLRRMVDDLFVLTQLDAGELPIEPLAVDLSELVDGAVEAVAALGAKHGVAVDAAVPAGIHARVDPHAVDRVLRNLLDNAIRHAPRGTTVQVGAVSEDGAVTVRIHDEGAGFPEGFAARAFDRFSRADEARVRRGGGAGLGLAIARELVEAHGGAIWIEPPPGGSVAFRIPADLHVASPAVPGRVAP